MWTKKSIGETAVESVNAGISSGVIAIPDEVYEYTLSASETSALLAGLGGSTDFSVSLGIDLEEALKHPAIRLVAEADISEDHIKLETLLVEIAQAYANGDLANVSYQSSRSMGLSNEGQFDLNLNVVGGDGVLYANVAQSGGVSLTDYHFFITYADGSYQVPFIGHAVLPTGTLDTSSASNFKSSFASYLRTNTMDENGGYALTCIAYSNAVTPAKTIIGAVLSKDTGSGASVRVYVTFDEISIVDGGITHNYTRTYKDAYLLRPEKEILLS